MKIILSTDLHTFINILRLELFYLFFLKFCKKNIVKTYTRIRFCFKMTNNRPLSPHLSIHKKVLTAVFSIFHRFTGIALSLGTIFIALWISLIALGPNFFYVYEQVASSLLFKFILFFWTLGIFYHLFNGIRYLYWSFGWGMDLKTVYSSGYLVLFFTIVATFIVWFYL